MGLRGIQKNNYVAPLINFTPLWQGGELISFVNVHSRSVLCMCSLQLLNKANDVRITYLIEPCDWMIHFFVGSISIPGHSLKFFQTTLNY